MKERDWRASKHRADWQVAAYYQNAAFSLFFHVLNTCLGCQSLISRTSKHTYLNLLQITSEFHHMTLTPSLTPEKTLPPYSPFFARLHSDKDFMEKDGRQ